MSLIKGDKLTVVLLIVLLLSVGLSLYSIASYQGSSSLGTTASTFHPGFQQGGGSSQMGNRPTPGKESSTEGRHTQPPSDRSRTGSSEGYSAGKNHNGSFPTGGGGGRSITSSAPYAAPLAVFTLLFFGLVASAYYWINRRKPQIQETNKSALVWTLLGTGLMLRIAAAPWIPGHPFDINLFKSWATSAADHLTQFYLNGSSDYPPFYVFILYGVGKLASLSMISPYFTLLIKLPSIVADVATAYLLYKVARNYVSFEISLLIAAFYTWNPAVFINSTFWGQVDSFFTLIVIAAFLMLSRNKQGWATALLTAAVLMKPQGIIYLPILLFELVRLKRLKAWLITAASAVATAVLVVAPFSWGQEPLWLFKLYASTLGEYPYASVNAYNFFALLGANYKSDTATLFLFSYHTWGMAFIVILTLFSWWMYTRGGSNRLAPLIAALQIAGVFTFSSSMHERYLFPAAALVLLSYGYIRDQRLLWLAAGFSLTIFLNTYAVFYHATNGEAPYNVTLFVTSLLNVLLCGYLGYVVWDVCSPKKAVLSESLPVNLS